MTENEQQLINLIRESNNQEQALIVATNIIINFLKQHESSQWQVFAFLQVLY